MCKKKSSAVPQTTRAHTPKSVTIVYKLCKQTGSGRAAENLLSLTVDDTVPIAASTLFDPLEMHLRRRQLKEEQSILPMSAARGPAISDG